MHVGRPAVCNNIYIDAGVRGNRPQMWCLAGKGQGYRLPAGHVSPGEVTPPIPMEPDLPVSPDGDDRYGGLSAGHQRIRTWRQGGGGGIGVEG